MKKFLLVLFAVLLYATAACAQEYTYITPPPSFTLAEPMLPSTANIPTGAFITPMRVGDRAASPGVLYSLEANAWLMSEMQRVQAVWILEMDTRVQLMLVWANHELTSQENRNTATLEILHTQLEAAYRNANDLSDQNRRLAAQVGWTRREKFRFVISVVGVGAIAGMGGYFIGRITR